MLSNKCNCCNHKLIFERDDKLAIKNRIILIKGNSLYIICPNCGSENILPDILIKADSCVILENNKNNA